MSIENIATPLGGEYQVNTETGEITPNCPPLLEFPQEWSLRYAGAEVKPFTNTFTSTVTTCSFAVDITNVLQAILTPLSPIFSILDCIQKVSNFGKAVKKAVKPPNPRKLSRALKEMTTCIEALAIFFPQINIPYMLCDMIDAVVMALKCLQETMANTLTLHADYTKIAQEMNACNQVKSFGILECTWNNVINNTNRNINVIARMGVIFDVMNSFIEFLGIKDGNGNPFKIPSLSSIGNLSDNGILPLIDEGAAEDFQNGISTVLQTIDGIILILDTLRNNPVLPCQDLRDALEGNPVVG